MYDKSLAAFAAGLHAAADERRKRSPLLATGA
jgi:hypothetical protein